MLNSTCGCLVPIFTMSTLGSVSIKGKRFQERSILLRETCKENAQSGALWVPFHSCSHTQGHAHSMSPLSLRRLRHTEKHIHRHKMDTRRHAHTDTHADTQTLTLIHKLFCFNSLNSCRKSKNKLIPCSNRMDLAHKLLSYICLPCVRMKAVS